MVILERAKTPDGVDIQLEDWSEDERTEPYRLVIGAYPMAKRMVTDNCWVRVGERFRLHIGANRYTKYSNTDVRKDYAALKSGKKSFEDLAVHFWNTERDMYVLGMPIE